VASPGAAALTPVSLGIERVGRYRPVTGDESSGRRIESVRSSGRARKDASSWGRHRRSAAAARRQTSAIPAPLSLIKRTAQPTVARSANPINSTERSGGTNLSADVYHVLNSPNSKSCGLVVIDTCDGIQVGRDNVQKNKFTYKLIDPTVEISKSLVRNLLEGKESGTDSFSTDAPVSLPQRRSSADGLADCFTGGYKQALASSGGDQVLVVVRHSRGVQVGNDGLQLNHFRTDLNSCSVRVERLASNWKRQDAIDRLRSNPEDSEAAGMLVRDIVKEATRALRSDVRDKVKKLTERPLIEGFSAVLREEIARSVGERSRIKTTSDVTATGSRASGADVLDAAREAQKRTARPGPDTRSRPGPYSPIAPW
jgi:hypothetical protein